MQPDAQGKYPYTGSLDCAMKTLKAGGPFKFYTGFPVYCVRIAPHVMVTSLSLSPPPPPHLVRSSGKEVTLSSQVWMQNLLLPNHYSFTIFQIIILDFTYSFNWWMWFCADDLDIPEPNHKVPENHRVVILTGAKVVCGD